MKALVVAVKYLNESYNRTYEFLTDINDLQNGDLVVVHAATGYGLANVVEYVNPDSAVAKAWVVQKVDLTAHNDRLAKLQRKAELLKKMEARRKKLDNIGVYRMLARHDEEMKSMLEELEGLE